ncbi:hypothetical protein BMMON2_02970 [Burkholderia mallei]
MRFDVGNQIVEKRALHLFLAVDVPIGAALRHYDHDGRDIAALDQRVGGELQAALRDPVVRVAGVAVQQVQHGVARAFGVVAGRQIHGVRPVPVQRGRAERAGDDAAGGGRVRGGGERGGEQRGEGRDESAHDGVMVGGVHMLAAAHDGRRRIFSVSGGAVAAGTAAAAAAAAIA